MNKISSTEPDSRLQPTSLFPAFLRQKTAAATVTFSTPVYRAASSQVHIGPVFARWKDPAYLKAHRRDRFKSTEMPPKNDIGIVFEQERITARDFQHPPDHRLHLPIAGQTPETPRKMNNKGQATSKWPSAPNGESSSSRATTPDRHSSARLVEKPNALGLSSEVVDAIHKQLSREEAQREITTPVFDWDGAREERGEGKVDDKARSKKDDRTWTAFVLAGCNSDKRPWK